MLEEICHTVLTRSLELIKDSSNLDPTAYKNLLIHLARMRKTEITKKSLLLWRYDSEQTQRKLNDPSSLILIPNEVHSFDEWTPPELLDHLRKAGQRLHQQSHKNGTSYTLLEKIEAQALNACRYQIGNCGEFASVCTLLLMELPVMELPALAKPIYIHRLILDGNKHACILLSEEKEINPNEPNTWSEDAWIIDGWYKETYQVKTEIQKISNNSNECSESWQSLIKGTLTCFSDERFRIGRGHSPSWEAKSARKGGNLWEFTFENYIQDKPRVPFKI